MISKPVNISLQLEQLDVQLATHLEKSIGEFCFMKGISREEISENDYCKALNEVARNLGFKISAEAERSTVTF